MPLAGLFRRRPRPDTTARERIGDWARAHGGFPAGTVLKVSEIACPDPACPGDETVILIMEPGARTRAVKIVLALAEVEEEDVRVALEAGT